MRMLMNVKIPHKEFNAAVKDGTAGTSSSTSSKSLSPRPPISPSRTAPRGAVLVVDMADASQIPAYAEPWFLTFALMSNFASP